MKLDPDLELREAALTLIFRHLARQIYSISNPELELAFQSLNRLPLLSSAVENRLTLKIRSYGGFHHEP
jgi:hypothetical protein